MPPPGLWGGALRSCPGGAPGCGAGPGLCPGVRDRRTAGGRGRARLPRGGACRQGGPGPARLLVGPGGRARDQGASARRYRAGGGAGQPAGRAGRGAQRRAPDRPGALAASARRYPGRGRPMPAGRAGAWGRSPKPAEGAGISQAVGQGEGRGMGPRRGAPGVGRPRLGKAGAALRLWGGRTGKAGAGHLAQAPRLPRGKARGGAFPTGCGGSSALPFGVGGRLGAPGVGHAQAVGRGVRPWVPRRGVGKARVGKARVGKAWGARRGACPGCPGEASGPGQGLGGMRSWPRLGGGGRQGAWRSAWAGPPGKAGGGAEAKARGGAAARRAG